MKKAFTEKGISFVSAEKKEMAQPVAHYSMEQRVLDEPILQKKPVWL